MIVSQAIVTSQGNDFSRCCCCSGNGNLLCCWLWRVKYQQKRTKILSCGPLVLTEGDIISVDGYSGRIYSGEIPTTLVEHNQDLQRLLSWADEVAILQVRAECRDHQRFANCHEIWCPKVLDLPVRNICSLDKNESSKCDVSF